MIVIHFVDGKKLVDAVSVGTVQEAITAVADCHKETQGNIDGVIVNKWSSFSPKVQMELMSAIAESHFGFPPDGKNWTIGQLIKLTNPINAFPYVLAVDAKLAIAYLAVCHSSI
jgi:hypothetical protein